MEGCHLVRNALEYLLLRGLSLSPSPNRIGHTIGITYLQHLVLSHRSHYQTYTLLFHKIYLPFLLYNSDRRQDSFRMSALPNCLRRHPVGPLGFLNYPPEIMNQIYQYLLVDRDQILVFLCSTDVRLRQLNLKRCINRLSRPTNQVQWSHVFDSRYYADSTGVSAQFLRVCKKIWLEGCPILYGNLTIAMRPSPGPDPCLVEHFHENSAYILAWANKITLQMDLLSAIRHADWAG